MHPFSKALLYHISCPYANLYPIFLPPTLQGLLASFLSIHFSILSRETTFLESKAGGPPTRVVPTPADARCFFKKIFSYTCRVFLFAFHFIQLSFRVSLDYLADQSFNFASRRLCFPWLHRTFSSFFFLARAVSDDVKLLIILSEAPSAAPLSRYGCN